MPKLCFGYAHLGRKWVGFYVVDWKYFCLAGLDSARSIWYNVVDIMGETWYNLGVFLWGVGVLFWSY